MAIIICYCDILICTNVSPNVPSIETVLPSSVYPYLIFGLSYSNKTHSTQTYQAICLLSFLQCYWIMSCLDVYTEAVRDNETVNGMCQKVSVHFCYISVFHANSINQLIHILYLSLLVNSIHIFSSQTIKQNWNRYLLSVLVRKQ